MYYRFQHISHLYLLGLIPVFIVLFVSMILWRNARLKKLGESRLVTFQLLGHIKGRNTLKFILLLVAFTAMVGAWANLQAGAGIDKVQRKGVDVVIALDVSKSMLANDIQPDRLTRAKQLIMRMLDKMQNDRVALIIFAGRAYLQVPLTVDYSAMKMMLQNVNPSMVPTQGTVIGEAVDLALSSFSQKEKKYKSLILISDGEDHDENAISKVKDAAESGIVVHTIGVGSPEGTTLFDPETRSVKKDENGAPVVSKLNEDELRTIASTGHGTYTLLRNTDDAADKLVNEIDGMEQKSLGAVVFNSYKNYFQYFLAVALLALLAEWVIPSGSSRGKMRSVRTTVSILVLLLAATNSYGQSTKLVSQGNKLYQAKKYPEAANAYMQALSKNPTYTPGMFNLGNALFQQKNYNGARQVMASAAKNTNDKQLKAGANYNIGNTYMQEQKWEDAIDAYKKALRANPQDEAAKYNLSYALAMMKKQGGGGKNKDKNNKDQQQNQNQQNKDNKQNQDKDQQKNQDQQNKGDQKDQNKQDQDKQQDQPQQSQPQPSKLSEKQAEQLLNALQQEEKKLQDKKQKGKGIPVKVDKDW